jgi:hypothetical protein
MILKGGRIRKVVNSRDSSKPGQLKISTTATFSFSHSTKGQGAPLRTQLQFFNSQTAPHPP